MALFRTAYEESVNGCQILGASNNQFGSSYRIEGYSVLRIEAECILFLILIFYFIFFNIFALFLIGIDIWDGVNAQHRSETGFFLEGERGSDVVQLYMNVYELISIQISKAQ